MENENNNKKDPLLIYAANNLVGIRPSFAIELEQNSNTTNCPQGESSCMKEQFMQLAEIAVAEYLMRKRSKTHLF